MESDPYSRLDEELLYPNETLGPLQSWRELIDKSHAVDGARAETRAQARAWGRTMLIRIINRLEGDIDSFLNNLQMACDLGNDPYESGGKTLYNLTGKERLARVFDGYLLEDSDFSSSLMKKIRRQTKNVDGKSQGYTELIVPFIALVLANQKAEPGDEQILLHPRVAEDAAAWLLRYTERKLAQQVITDLNDSTFPYSTLDRTSSTVLTLYAKGVTTRKIALELGLEGTEDQVKGIGRVIHQLSFGRPTSPPRLSRIHWFTTVGTETGVLEVKKFIDEITNYGKPDSVTDQAGYQRWGRVIGVIRKLPTLSDADIFELFTQVDSIKKIAAKLNVNSSQLRELVRCFDEFTLEAKKPQEIFSGRDDQGKLSDLEIARFFATIIQKIASNKFIRELLPARTDLIIQFMNDFGLGIGSGAPFKQVVLELSQKYSLNPAEIYALKKKALLLGDYIDRMEGFPIEDRWSNPITQAQQYLNLIDYIKKK